MKITLAERYQSFRRQHEADYPTGKDLDKAFLIEVLTKGYGTPDKGRPNHPEVQRKPCHFPLREEACKRS